MPYLNQNEVVPVCSQSGRRRQSTQNPDFDYGVKSKQSRQPNNVENTQVLEFEPSPDVEEILKGDKEQSVGYESTHIRKYHLNKEKLMKQKLEAGERYPISTEIHDAAITVTLSAYAFKLALEECIPQFYKSEELVIKGSCNGDLGGLIENDILRIYCCTTQGLSYLYTVNPYRTSSRLMINGKNWDLFEREHLPALCELIMDKWTPEKEDELRDDVLLLQELITQAQSAEAGMSPDVKLCYEAHADFKWEPTPRPFLGIASRSESLDRSEVSSIADIRTPINELTRPKTLIEITSYSTRNSLDEDLSLVSDLSSNAGESIPSPADKGISSKGPIKNSIICESLPITSSMCCQTEVHATSIASCQAVVDMTCSGTQTDSQTCQDTITPIETDASQGSNEQSTGNTEQRNQANYTEMYNLFKDMDKNISSVFEKFHKREDNLNIQLLQKSVSELMEEVKAHKKQLGAKDAEIKQLKLEQQNYVNTATTIKKQQEHIAHMDIRVHELLTELNEARNQQSPTENQATNESQPTHPELSEKVSELREKCSQLARRFADVSEENEVLLSISKDRFLQILELQKQVSAANDGSARVHQICMSKQIDMSDKLSELNQKMWEFTNSNATPMTLVTHNNRSNHSETSRQTPAPAQPAAENVRPTPAPRISVNRNRELPREESPPLASIISSSANSVHASKTTQYKGTIRFKGRSNALSNWAPCDMEENGIKFTTLEQLYFHKKLIAHGEHSKAEDILKIHEGCEIKQIGDSIIESVEWRQKKLAVMEELLRQKFEKPVFRKELAKTYPNQLDHNVSSPFWGTSGGRVKGSNHLGNLLMKIREEIVGTDPSVQHSDTSQESKPEVLVLGHSHTNYFEPSKVQGVRFTKHRSYNIVQATDFVNSAESLPPKVIVHLITNDLKNKPLGLNMSPSECHMKLKSLAQTIEQKHGSEVLISLAMPAHIFQLQSKIRETNILLKADSTLKTIDHDRAFIDHGQIIPGLHHDQTHPNNEGLRRLVTNWKTALGISLKIKYRD